MKNITITADIVSALFLTVMLIGQYLQLERGNRKFMLFRHCMLLCTGALIVDAVAYLLDGRSSSDALVATFVYLSYILIDALAICFSLYLQAVVRERDPEFKNDFVVFICILAIIDVTLITVGAATGNVFAVENGEIIAGPWISAILIVPTFYIISIMVLLIAKRKVLGTRDTVILSLYCVMPALTACMQLYHYQLGSGYLGGALALTIIFVLIQCKSVYEATLQARIYDDLSVTDLLTGLKNRRGYEFLLQEVGPNERIAVIFCDANSLKTINDNQGHEAGDRYLQKLANLIRNAFPEGTTSRISGDEFVVLMPMPEQQSFLQRMEAFGETLASNDRIASFGYAFGEGGGALELVKEAEQMMYADKSRYYKETGRDRRR